MFIVIEELINYGCIIPKESSHRDLQLQLLLGCTMDDDVCVVQL